MKDIIISSKRQKKELTVFLICFIVAEIINALSIVVYDTNWSELFTHIGYVFVLAVGIYLFLLFIRLICNLISRLFKNKK